MTLALYKKGYTFVGWAVSASGGTIFKDDDSSLKPSEINPNLVYGSCSTTLYAQWKKTNDIYNLGEETYSFCNFGDSDSPGGHCFGMSMTSAGYYLNELDITYLDLNDSSKLYSVSQTSKVNAPICHYQGIQGEFSLNAIVAGGAYYKYRYKDVSSDWDEVVNYVKNHNYDNTGALQIGFRKLSEGGHAINFLRYERVNGEDRIYAYDNNFPDVETYFCKTADGKVYQKPYSTFSGAIDCIALRSLEKYFDLAAKFDYSRVIYGWEDTIKIEGVNGYPMELDGLEDYMMFVIPDTMTEVQIIPLVENAGFEYVDESYTFDENFEDTVGVLKLASINDEGITEKESNFVIKSSSEKVDAVNIGEMLSLTYKSSVTLVPDISINSNAKYTVEYSSSNPSVAYVDEFGEVYAAGEGVAEITCTVTDEYGNVLTDACEVNVSYAWWQWIIRILLLGFLWY